MTFPWKKALPFLAIGVGAAILFASSSAAAAPSVDGPAQLSNKAAALLSRSGFAFAPSNLTLLTLDAINLVPLEAGAPSAMTWAATQKNLGRSILVPIQLLDGKDHGNGMPTSVLAVLPADAKNLLMTGLYAEWVS